MFFDLGKRGNVFSDIKRDFVSFVIRIKSFTFAVTLKPRNHCNNHNNYINLGSGKEYTKPYCFQTVIHEQESKENKLDNITHLQLWHPRQELLTL